LKNHTDKLSEDGREFLELINGSANRMSSLIHDLLRFSKLSKSPLDTVEVDMHDLVCETLKEVKASTTDYKAEVSVQGLSMAYCDQGLMRQVWQNLIGNAVKYSSKKEKPIVEIGCREINSEPVYYIKDNGAGFDSAYASKLFTAFQRLHGPEDFEGTGVGLATVHKIITKHGGRIWADAEIDKGATFYFTLPQV
jgi:light-regulated signal transduction histidine kinase (bacteriophytochrome)